MQIASHTLGCKLNNAETSAIMGDFRMHNWEISQSSDGADVFLLNTCSVTNNAEKECRQIIRRILRQNPKTFIAVTGCYAQLRPEEIASIEGVDVVLGTKEKFNLHELFSSFEKLSVPRIYSSPVEEATEFHLAATADTDERTRAFLKVQDGCDYTCSFCTIPLARGQSRSTEINHILGEARRLSSDGFREIVLSGVNVGDFGRKNGSSFFELVTAIENDVEITARIRISSIEPNLLSDEIIDLVASSKKFCPHFHIPLQSGSPKILKLMQRRYTADLYRARIERIKELMPQAGIGVDVIVGFPGETDEDFLDTYNFLHDLDISYLHVFTYSERPDTKAISMNHSVPSQKRKERNSMLRILSEKKRRDFYCRQEEGIVTVLIESSQENPSHEVETCEGYSENYVRVTFDPGSVPHDADLVRARLGITNGESVHGEFLQIVSRRATHTLLPILQ
ncbi:MAG: tRNA (N(6)-L-threonylcarbamoyladenosine(37)-C(2))-methylthiotransferase MtaB [Bacteroidota bacterium]|nr:tRNA (N(6)-L-threonylcarbamoyladenosine(37)-C(2))-methylthiotransferase MtaB [Bacteroidota bacterium]MDP4229038.1 tRNA (N(6)-L-threonylcarbamoyladenosine(37)-C(2))-methylthiotransferase MtaB [Bacteroidota bacterium]MDP4235429.1 tRNA (N(6)-L-threonylcarbamoyladenosine(37)-C(2))-methylthiotransferase MtaB [Bacteroidota bacterium]